MISCNSRLLTCVAMLILLSGCPAAEDAAISQNPESSTPLSEPSVPDAEPEDQSEDVQHGANHQGKQPDQSDDSDDVLLSVDHSDPQSVANAFLHAVRNDEREVFLQLWLPSEREAMRAMVESPDGKRELEALKEAVKGDFQELTIDVVGDRARANFQGGSFDMERAENDWFMSSGGAIERESDPEDKSRRNINQLMLGILLFANANERWPETFEDTRPVLKERGQDLDVLLKNPWTGDSPGYEYVKPTTPPDDTPYTTIVIYQLRDGKRAPKEKVGYSDGASRYPR